MNHIDLMKYWMESSNNDYDAMNILFNNEKYTWSLFVGHLVIEKLLKALYAKMHKNTPYAPKSHDLSYLALKIPLELTEEEETLLSIITRFNIDGRYDDYKNNFYNLCTEEYTKNSIAKINTVRSWLIELLHEESEEEKGEQ